MTNAASPAPKTTAPLGMLGLMMFLQFFIWGAWYVPVTGWLGSLGIGGVTVWVYSVCPIAAIVSPVFLGVIADRFFPSQRVLGILHILGALCMIAVPFVVTPENPGAVAENVWMRVFHPCVLLFLLHALCFMPTLALSSSVALAHIKNAEKQFPIVRVAGTIGWIVAGLVVSLLLPGGDKSPAQFYLVGAAGLALGVLSFMLPNTPPPLAGKKVGIGQLLGLDAISLLKNPQFAVFILCSLLICIPLAGYYQEARNFVDYSGVADPAFKMTFGQMSEVFFMAIMPFIIIRLGVKKMLLCGMLAWVARYGLFALGAPDLAGANSIIWMILLGIILHGICYDFFFVAGQIYVDKDTPHAIRGQAQAFFVLITQGVGMLIGAQVINRIAAANTSGGGIGKIVNWQQIWLWPCVAAGVIALIFAVFFKEKKA